MKIALLLLLLTFPVIAQDRGELTDLKGMKKVFISANSEQRKQVTKDVGKLFTIVPRIADAEFVLEYTVLSRQMIQSVSLEQETDQLDAYYMKEGVKVVAWSGDAYDGFSKTAAQKVTSQFLKAIKKLTTSPAPR